MDAWDLIRIPDDPRSQITGSVSGKVVASCPLISLSCRFSCDLIERILIDAKRFLAEENLVLGVRRRQFNPNATHPIRRLRSILKNQHTDNRLSFPTFDAANLLKPPLTTPHASQAAPQTLPRGSAEEIVLGSGPTRRPRKDRCTLPSLEAASYSLLPQPATVLRTPVTTQLCGLEVGRARPIIYLCTAWPASRVLYDECLGSLPRNLYCAH